jgi:hypothetical protein
VSECSVYIFGYPHAQFHHVVKVGISNNVFARLASIQSHNPDCVVPHFHFDFTSRDEAFAIEQEFHRRFNHFGIRGEWLGMGEYQAIYLLSIVIVRRLAARYVGDDLRSIRESCGLLKAFAILDECESDEIATYERDWNETEEYVG